MTADTSAEAIRDTTIYPTHTCFDDALDYVTEAIKQDKRLIDRLRIIHGICLMPEGPKKDAPYAHAWVEDGQVAWQAGLLDGERIWYCMPVTDLRTLLRVQELTVYTVRQAARENQRTEHYGPWEERYERLTRDNERVERKAAAP